MVYILIFIFTTTLLGSRTVAQFCNDVEEVFLKTDNMLHPKTDGGFLMTTTASRTDCVSKCVRKPGCSLTYHNPSDDDCFLVSNSHILVPDTTYTDNNQNRFDKYRNPGKASSCMEVKVCGDIDIDGEYWLYPSILQGEKVKVFCSAMDTQSPKEFISLTVTNSINYPPECNLNCHGDKTTGCPGSGGGHSDYTKIRVDIYTMIVDGADRTFATSTGEALDYGAAKDCYNTIWSTPTDPTLPCGPRGTFQVDTTGTGLKLSSETVWTTIGYLPEALIEWSSDGKVVNGICGGWCGRCTPNELKLELNPAENIPDGSASEIQCV